jgi:hypothetical protein
MTGFPVSGAEIPKSIISCDIVSLESAASCAVVYQLEDILPTW